MSTNFLRGSVAIVMLAATGARAAELPNLAPNGGFEDAPTEGAAPTGWSHVAESSDGTREPADTQSVFAQTAGGGADSGEPQDHAARLHLDSADKWMYGQSPITLDAPLVPGDLIRFTVAAKAAGPARFELYIEARGKQEGTEQYARVGYDATEQWQTCEAELVVGPVIAGQTAFRVLVQLYTAGVDLLLDDVVVTRTDASAMVTPAKPAVEPDDAITLNGKDQFIALDDSRLVLIDSPITVEAWFRTTDTFGVMFECGEQNRDASPQAGYALYMSNGQVRFGVNNGLPMFTHARWDDARTKRTYNDGKWHHAMGVFPADGRSRVRLYIDGKIAKVTRAGAAQPALSAYTPVKPMARIGSRTSRFDFPDPGYYLWQGQLAQVRVWRTVQDVPGDDKSLIGEWTGGQPLTRFVFEPPIIEPFFPVDPLVFPVDDFDYPKYPSNITGYTGQNLQRVGVVQYSAATRVRVGERGYYKSGIAQRPDGSLVIAACRQHPDYQRDAAQRYFQVHVFESGDRGRTWRRIDQADLVGKEPALAALPDGVLILTSQNSDYRPTAAKGRMNLYRSADGGRTWEKNEVDEHDAPYPYPRNILVDKDGTLTFLWAEQSDITRCRSTDGGRTWTTMVGKCDWDPKDMNITTLFAEVGICRLPDGRLLATLRREIPETAGEGFEDTYLTESSDDGKSWLRPWRMSGTAEVHAYPLPLADGRLLMTWSNYHLPYGAAAALSTDGGRTWDRDRIIQLAISANCYTGWAASVQLDDSSVVTTYATTIYLPEKGKPTSACEVVRWRLP